MSQRVRILRTLFLACIVLGGAGVFAWALPRVKHALRDAPVAPVEKHPEELTELVNSEVDTLRLPSTVVVTMGLRTQAATLAPPPAPLKLEGSLFLDPSRMTRVHTRFPGEVMKIGEVEGNPDDQNAAAGRVMRPVRFGDRVKGGQLLAVVWCKDLGEKKSEMLNAISLLTLDQETLERLNDLYKKGAIPERSVREQEQKVESDMINVRKAQQTLETWRLAKEDIEEIRAEAARIHKQQGDNSGGDDAREKWARVEVKAAQDGTVVEKNVAVGDVVDTTLDLFKIADLTRLDVLANAYEEDLPLLQDLPPDQHRWSINLKSDPSGQPLKGSFDQIGNIIDPNTHAALVMGWVDNSAGRLRVGQFVTAIVELPTYVDEVAVPSAAVVDANGNTYIFIQPDQTDLRYSRRQVLPVRRRDDLIYFSSKLSKEQEKAGLKPLHAGERVVVSGGLELCNELDNLEAAAKIANK
jgi:cobalt-zinc-cadmium efflux system membrane fusion protein